MATKREVAQVEERSVVVPDPDLLAEVLASAFSPGETLDVFSLPRIKLPMGNGQYWTMPDGPPVKEFSGVIILRHAINVYWQTGFDESGGGTPPDCQSLDKVLGVGTPGGDCHTCPLRKWKSGRNGGKACQEKTRVFLLTEGSMLPTMLVLPAISYLEFQAYCASRVTWHVQTTFGLTTDKSSTGIDFSRATFRAGEKLSVADCAAVDQYQEGIMSMLKALPAAAEAV